jgi:hypothetical protein
MSQPPPCGLYNQFPAPGQGGASGLLDHPRTLPFPGIPGLPRPLGKEQDLTIKKIAKPAFFDGEYGGSPGHAFSGLPGPLAFVVFIMVFFYYVKGGDD